MLDFFLVRILSSVFVSGIFYIEIYNRLVDGFYLRKYLDVYFCVLFLEEENSEAGFFGGIDYAAYEFGSERSVFREVCFGEFYCFSC